LLEDIMTETKIETNLATDPLTKDIVSDLAGTAGPCITLLLPPYRPGERCKPAAALLKLDLQEAAKKLAARRIAKPLIAELLEPLHQLCHEDQWLAGSGCSRVIFRSPQVFRQFDLPVAPWSERACIVGDCFWIRGTLAALALPAKVYVLEVTKKAVALMACGFKDVSPLGLPKGTPHTLEEALAFDPPDHDLLNRSAAGPSNGTMGGVQFGTGSGRETQHAYLHDFYRAVDRGIHELLRTSQAPLILAGVDEDMAMYRSISTYGNLLEQGIHGSPGAAMTRVQILRHAHDIALFSAERRVGLEMAVSKERFGPARFLVDFDNILRAAVEGRVSDLYLDDYGRRMGSFASTSFGGHNNWHDEDLLNVAAVETLLRRGNVCSLPSHLMPRGAVAAATLRY
jgi:hypothetical protein